MAAYAWGSKGTTCKTTKGYPRVTAGPLRHKYIHRVVAEAMLGRELRKDEEVHHKDADRRNFAWQNLLVLGESDHGWASNRQRWFMDHQDDREKIEWDQYMASQGKETLPDGRLQREWNERGAGAGAGPGAGAAASA